MRARGQIDELRGDFGDHFFEVEAYLQAAGIGAKPEKQIADIGRERDRRRHRAESGTLPARAAARPWRSRYMSCKPQRPIADGRGLQASDQIVHLRQHRDHQPSVVEYGLNGLLQISRPLGNRSSRSRLVAKAVGGIALRLLHEANQRVCNRADLDHRRVTRLPSAGTGSAKHMTEIVQRISQHARCRT